MRQVQLSRLSWKQAEEAFKEKPVILIPVGAVEAHGPHLPLGADSQVAEEVAIRAAQQSPALVVPPLWYGYAAQWRKFPGNISTQPSVVQALVHDIVCSLLPFGLDRFVFVDNHFGNEEALELAARQFREERGLLIANFYPWVVMGRFGPDLYDDYPSVFGHGAEPNTSVMMYLYPEDVDMSLAVKGGLDNYKGYKMTGGKRIDFRGIPVDLYVDMDEITPSGVTAGDPFPATAERGKILLERTAAALAEFVTAFRDIR
jgi:creatinine amidohydrolase